VTVVAPSTVAAVLSDKITVCIMLEPGAFVSGIEIDDWESVPYVVAMDIETPAGGFKFSSATINDKDTDPPSATEKLALAVAK